MMEGVKKARRILRSVLVIIINVDWLASMKQLPIAHSQLIILRADFAYIVPHQRFWRARVSGRIPQQVGWMEDRHDPSPIDLCPLSAQTGDAGLFEDGLTGYIPGQQDHMRVNQADDLKDIWAVIFNFLIGGFPKGFPIFSRRQSKN
jgi:hypothetical protein